MCCKSISANNDGGKKLRPLFAWTFIRFDVALVFDKIRINAKIMTWKSLTEHCSQHGGGSDVLSLYDEDTI